MPSRNTISQPRAVRSAKTPLPVRVSSGAGFDFEDQISAWLMVKMVAGEPAPGVEGAASQIQAQVSALGWHVDDLLLTAQHSSGEIRRLAVSVKGNLQVSGAGLPADFVQRAWSQWLDPSSPLKKSQDVIALAAYGRHAEFEATWREVKAACRGTDVALALARIRKSRKQAKVFDSVQSPNGRNAQPSDEETVALVRQLEVVSFDFQSSSSEDESQAIGLCRRVLESGDLGEAEKLWSTLIRIASKVRMELGTLKLHELLRLLRGDFSLRDHPDYRRDWEVLEGVTEDGRAYVDLTLPTGQKLDRENLHMQIQAALTEHAATVVMGDSGTGKSALVKSVLDQKFPHWRQIWLRPGTLCEALSAQRRTSLPLRHELQKTLLASARAENVLVIDSAERIESADLGVVRSLVQQLISPSDGVHAWRVLVISQTHGGALSHETILEGQAPKLVEVGPLEASEVKAALASTPSLSWLNEHSETISALTNLKTLAWVVSAGAKLGLIQGRTVSHVDIAERLWEHWTENSVTVKALMMRLAKREASFQRSFALTDLDPADLEVFQNRPQSLPLVLIPRRDRIEFAHDLAADWARFQYLKQYDYDPHKWATLAGNPLWTSSLRMLGQSLLRETVGSQTQWDLVFKSAEASDLTLVQNLLLDALFLDPEARRFLSERADFLFANNGHYLERLLARFLHIATVPKPEFAGIKSAAGIYMESTMRTIVFGRWPAMLVFLDAQRDRVGKLSIPALARVLQMWLVEAPRTTPSGEPFPLRLEVAQMALAMARTVQVGLEHGVLYVDFDPVLFTAAMAGAADIPDEVSEFALEMCRRKDPHESVLVRVGELRRKKAAEHAQRLRTDERYRASHEERASKRESIPFSFPSLDQPLKPWPMGAKRKVERHFRKVCFDSGGLFALMKARPKVAAEVLLALLVDDEPMEVDHHSGDLEEHIGLQFSDATSAEAFWKSPFFAFLSAEPEVATNALIDLVNFATQRWGVAAFANGVEFVPQVKIETTTGLRSFFGNGMVAGWVDSNSMWLGDLARALSSFEWWLTHQLKTGMDMTPVIEQVLSRGSSVALLSVLASAGKSQPALFAGVLWPLLVTPKLFAWDHIRVELLFEYPASTHWPQQVLEESAHLKKLLKDVVIELLKADREFAMKLREASIQWPVPQDESENQRHRWLLAELDSENYRPQQDQDDDTEQVFVLPQALVMEARQWSAQSERPLMYATIPSRCSDWLASRSVIGDEHASWLYRVLHECMNDAGLDVQEKEHCVVALVAVLTVLAQDWWEQNADASDLLLAKIEEFSLKAGSLGDDDTGRGAHWRYTQQVRFAAQALTYLWATNERQAARWEPAMLALMTCSHHGTRVVFRESYLHRVQLGDAWWRLLRMGILWSGLSMLRPRHGEDDGLERRWSRWLGVLRGMRVRGVPTTSQDLRFDDVAVRVGRIDFARRMREYEAEEPSFRLQPKRRNSSGLNKKLLSGVFGWLIKDSGTGSCQLDAELSVRLWDYVIGRARTRSKETGEYNTLGQSLGYELIVKLVSLSLCAPAGQAKIVWEPVLKHGPAAHYALRQYFECFFMMAKQVADKNHVLKTWEEISEWVLNADWEPNRFWYHRERLIGDALGFGGAHHLDDMPSRAALTLKHLYEAWASERLHRVEENLTRFSAFLVTKFGAPLRTEGLVWISEAMAKHTSMRSWYRDDVPNSLVELVGTALSEDESTLSRNEDMRSALMSITATLVEKNIPAAFSLQERIKGINRA